MSRATRGVAWASGSRVASQSLQIATTIILARLLTPRDFGLAGIVIFFSGLATALTDLGLSQAIISLPRATQRHVSTAFLINVVSGILLSLMFVGSGPILAAIFSEPKLLGFAPVMGLVFALNFGVVPTGLLLREMQVKSVFAAETSGTVAGSALAIAAAVLGAGYWSLAVMPLALALVQSMVLLKSCKTRPNLQVSRAAARDLWRFSSRLTLAALVGYCGRNIDRLLIGRFIGTASLGIYSRAYALMLLPLWQVTQVIGRVVLPALSELRSDANRCRDVYVRGVGMVGLAAFPASLGTASVAPDLVPALLGPGWSGLVSVLQVLSIAGLVQAIVGTAEWVYQSRQRTDLQLKATSLTAALTMTGAGIGVSHSLIGVAFGVAAGISAGGLLNIARACRLLGVRISAVAGRLAIPLCNAMVMAAVVFSGRAILPPELAHGVRASIELLVGVVVYLLLSCATKGSAFQDMRSALMSLRRTGAVQ